MTESHQPQSVSPAAALGNSSAQTHQRNKLTSDLQHVRVSESIRKGKQRKGEMRSLRWVGYDQKPRGRTEKQ